MTDYLVTNTSEGGCSYLGSTGKRINFERGEKKKLKTLPPEARDVENYDSIPGWRIEEATKSTTDTDGGDN